VGTVGKTGNATYTPAHLHFEIHYPVGSRYTCVRCRGRKPLTTINPNPSLLAARVRR
jgi:murein DD-endopeptidase MepM/ murein hydrolase activator NlpD